MRCRLLALSILAACVLGTGAAPAGAQTGDPFSPLPQAPTAEPPVVVPTTEDDEGFAGWQQALLVAGGAVFVLAIGLAITRDARRRAPVDSRGGGGAADGPAGGHGGPAPGRGSVRPRDRRKARARARTARASRKKNR